MSESVWSCAPPSSRAQIKTGATINPAPCAEDIKNDQSLRSERFTCIFANVGAHAVAGTGNTPNPTSVE